MKYVYAALLLHSAGMEINENNLSGVLKAAGGAIDEVRVKALVAAVSEIDIDEALKIAPTTIQVSAPSPVEEKVTKEEEGKEEEVEEKKEEEALAGLGALFQ